MIVDDFVRTLPWTDGAGEATYGACDEPRGAVVTPAGSPTSCHAMRGMTWPGRWCAVGDAGVVSTANAGCHASGGADECDTAPTSSGVDTVVAMTGRVARASCRLVGRVVRRGCTTTIGGVRRLGPCRGRRWVVVGWVVGPVRGCSGRCRSGR